jgi:hypothetical protein
MKITAPFRGRRATKKLDLTDMRKAFADQRSWCSIGIVTAPDDGDPHFQITDDDILVEVVLQPSLVPVTCRLAAGMWLLPDVGEEVVVTLPEGELTFMPVIAGVLSTGVVPVTSGGGAQPPTPQRIVIARQQVVVHDGSGGANPLPTLASLQATIDKLNDVIDKFNGHKHLGVTAGAAISGLPQLTDLEVGSAAAAQGTTVLQGK